MFPPEFKDEYDELMALVLSLQVTLLPLVSTLLQHSCLCLDRSHPCLYVPCYEMLNEALFLSVWRVWLQHRRGGVVWTRL